MLVAARWAYESTVAQRTEVARGRTWITVAMWRVMHKSPYRNGKRAVGVEAHQGGRIFADGEYIPTQPEATVHRLLCKFRAGAAFGGLQLAAHPYH
jgi:hypothetical protein